MQALSNLLVENKALMIGAAAVAFFVAAVLILLVFRLAFGRRLRMPGGRARQMRLGIVDAFDLDRQRQLVIVRRDNVEHLVMIGGPNDILIESQIVRTEARPRDKEARDREPGYAAAPAAKPHAVEPKLGLPPMPEPQPVAATDTSLPAAARAAMPHLPSAAAPPGAPQRRTPPAPGKLPSVHDTPAGQGELLGKPQMPKPSVGGPPPAGAGQESPAFLRWPARPSPTPPQTAKQKQPGKLSEPSQPAPTPQAKPAVAPEPPAAWPPVPSLEGLESLEEEMAKLLGRGPGKS